jgi:hypothetical protein
VSKKNKKTAGHPQRRQEQLGGKVSQVRILAPGSKVAPSRLGEQDCGFPELAFWGNSRSIWQSFGDADRQVLSAILWRFFPLLDLS